MVAHNKETTLHHEYYKKVTKINAQESQAARCNMKNEIEDCDKENIIR